MAEAPAKKATASVKKAAAKAPAKKAAANARTAKATANAPAKKATANAKKAAAKAPAKKATANAPTKKAAVNAPAKKTAANVPAEPSVFPKTSNVTPDIEAAVERIKETSERVLELSKKNGLIWLAVLEKMLDGVLKLEEDTASDLGSDWIEKLVSTQADFIRDTSQAYFSAIKDRLK